MSDATVTLPEDQAIQPEASDESIVWIVRLSNGSPLQLAVIFAAAALAAVFGYVLFREVLLSIIGFAMILGSTAEYWLGTRFQVDARGASRRVGPSVSSIEWENVKRVVVEGRTLKLSPLEEVGRMDPFRGVKLVTNQENREAVIQAVRRFCNSDVRFLED